MSGYIDPLQLLLAQCVTRLNAVDLKELPFVSVAT